MKSENEIVAKNTDSNLAKKFIDATQRLILEFLMYQGVTIGAADIFLENDMTERLFDNLIHRF